MFKAVLSDPSILKSSFNSIASIVGEVQIRAEEDGLYLDALDQAHMLFVHLSLKADLFDVYDVDEALKLNVDTEELVNVLKRVKGDDVLELSCDNDFLNIMLEGEARRIFQINLIDLEYESPKPPSLEYPVVLELPFNLLKDVLKDVEIVHDKVNFKVDSDKFFASAEGEFGRVTSEYVHGEQVEDTVKSIFSLHKLKEIMRADKFSETAILKIGNDLPLNLSLKMPSDEGELNFLLAPRIEGEE